MLCGYAWVIRGGSFIFLCAALPAQVVTGAIQDTTGEPLPFVTVQNLRTRQGTYTDLQGRFTIGAMPTDTIAFRAIGYETRLLPAYQCKRVWLSSAAIEIAPVVIRASENPAYALIRGLQAQNARWNPLLRPHSYLSYNKLLVTLPDSLLHKDSVPAHLMIWETETEKLYIDRQRSQEKLLSQRLSGNLRIQSFFSPTSLQPLGLYESWITIVEKRFASPIGLQAFSYYDYELLDTLYQETDTLYHIRFFPLPNKTSWALTGHLYLTVPDYALTSIQGRVQFQGIEASTVFLEAFALQQIYEKLGDTLWFPVQLHTEVTFRTQLSAKSLPLYVRSRSYLRAIQVPPDRRTLPGERIIIPSLIPSLADSSRVEQLTSSERYSYEVLDSLIGQIPVARLGFLFDTPALISGRLPIGFWNLLLRPLLLYQAAEGWRPQVGLETSDRFLTWGRLRVWAGYGTGRAAGLLGSPWRYGGEVEIGQTWLFQLSAATDVVERTLPRLIDERSFFLPLTQVPYERFPRTAAFEWETLVNQRHLLAASRCLLHGRAWGILQAGWVERQAPGGPAIQRRLLSSGWEILPKEVLIQRGSLRLRAEIPTWRFRVTAGWLQPLQGWDRESWFWQADLLQAWQWGRWAKMQIRMSGGQIGPAVPDLWHHQPRTLPQSLLGQAHTLAAHPTRRLGRSFAYAFWMWEVPNNRFPKPRQWTPTLALLAQGGYLDRQIFPEVGFQLRNWLPQTASRYLRALSRLSFALYKRANTTLEKDWFFRVESGF